MNINRKKWLEIAKKSLLVNSGKDVFLNLLDNEIVAADLAFELRLAYPDHKAFPLTNIKIHALQLQAVLSLFLEGQIEVKIKENFMEFIEDSITISFPYFPISKEERESRFDANKNLLGHCSTRELKNALEVMDKVRGGVKSSGIAEYIYWEKNHLYAYNGSTLIQAEFNECPINRIAFPRNVVNFLIAKETGDYNKLINIFVYEPGIIEIHLGESTTTRFSLPQAPVVDWKELLPTIPNENWMGIPSTFLRLGQISNTLNTRHYGRVHLKWSNKKLTATGQSQFAPIDFHIEEEMVWANEREGEVDMVSLLPVLKQSNEMHWSKHMLIFKSNIYTFFYSLLNPEKLK